MRRFATIAFTILAGTHMAATQLAQGYGEGYSRRYIPRFSRPYEYDRPDRGYEPGVVTPERHRFDQDYREWRSIEPYRRLPPRRQGWGDEGW